jgi:hypothetical protein
MPATKRIELAQVGEKPMHCSIEVCRLLGDPLAQLLQFAIHDDLLPSGYDIASQLRFDGIGAMRMAVSLPAGGCCGMHMIEKKRLQLAIRDGSSSAAQSWWRYLQVLTDPRLAASRR